MKILSDTAIKLLNVSKNYPIITKNKSLFKKKESTERVVLNNLSISIKKGEVVGILGRNGSGKSTLLSIIAKIIVPDEGTVEINGKVASILELGMGFHQDLSGRENIYLKGELYGLGKKQIDERIDSIIEYAELGDYIDNPIRSYSSGMRGRLAFSIMINVDSEIMLVDEVLSTGDFAFSLKSIQHFKQMSKSGKTILFVSHNLSAISSMCSRTIWIESGSIVADGDSKSVCAQYQNKINNDPAIVRDLATYGVPEAQYNWAQLLKTNPEADKEYSSEYWLKKSADQGYIPAQLKYADYILSTNEVNCKETAIIYYENAAIKGDSEAKIKLSSLRSESSLITHQKAMWNLYEYFAEKGNPYFQLKCGELILNTAWSNSDNVRAYTWFEKSANQGNPDALHQLAMMNKLGIGTEKNIDKCIDLLIKAAELGHVKSQMSLADIYYEGKVILKNDCEAFKWYLKAAKLGNPKAQYQISQMYHTGEGIEINEDESKKWAKAYAMSPLVPYQFQLADILRYSKSPDGHTTEDLLLKNVETYNMNAALQLGHLYREGILVPPNSTKAKEYYNLAAEMYGTNRAVLADLYYKGIIFEQNLELAKQLYQSCLTYGDSTAAYRLALLSEKDSEEYCKLLEFATERGHRDSANRLIQKRGVE